MSLEDELRAENKTRAAVLRGESDVRHPVPVRRMSLEEELKDENTTRAQVIRRRDRDLTLSPEEVDAERPLRRSRSQTALKERLSRLFKC